MNLIGLARSGVERDWARHQREAKIPFPVRTRTMGWFLQLNPLTTPLCSSPFRAPVGETALQWAAQNSDRYLRFAGHRFVHRFARSMSTAAWQTSSSPSAANGHQHARFFHRSLGSAASSAVRRSQRCLVRRGGYFSSHSATQEALVSHSRKSATASARSRPAASLRRVCCEVTGGASPAFHMREPTEGFPS